jgi:predicted DNA-binding transcriptional regulator AlpA
MDANGNGASLFAGEYLSKKQFAAEIGKTERTVDRMVLQGDAPPITRIGRTALFRREAIRDWLLSREKGFTRASRKSRAGER